MMGIHMTCSWRKADSLLMNDSGKATMGDAAFVIEKHLSAGVQLPECPSDFRSSFESFRSETLSTIRVGKKGSSDFISCDGLWSSAIIVVHIL